MSTCGPPAVEGKVALRAVAVRSPTASGVSFVGATLWLGVDKDVRQQVPADVGETTIDSVMMYGQPV